MSLALLPALLLALPLTSGCGEGLKPSAFRGEPLHTINGSLRVGIDGVATGTRFALFWTTSPEENDGWVLDPATVGVFQAPSLFIVHVYQAPRVGADGYAVGALLAWHDADDDGEKDRDEPWAGGADAAVVVYAERSQPANGITTLPLEAGFTDLVAPLFCDARPLPIAGPDCPLTTGFDCVEDEDCDGEPLCRPDPECDTPDAPASCEEICNRSIICVESVLNSPLPNGVCLHLELDDFDDPTVCASDTRFVPLPGGSTRRISNHSLGVWIPACEAESGDDDCGLPGYACSAALGICLPPADFEVIGGVGREVPRVCIGAYDEEDALGFVRSRTGVEDETEGEDPEGEDPEAEEPEGEEPEPEPDAE